MMINKTNSLFRDEEDYKEKVYYTFDQMRADCHADVKLRRTQVESGAYDDKVAFMPIGELHAAEEKRHKIESLI